MSSVNVIPLLTLFLTPLLSAAVVYFQLSREHGFVQSQRKLMKAEHRLELKIDIQRRFARELAEYLGLKRIAHFRSGLALMHIICKKELGLESGDAIPNATRNIQTHEAKLAALKAGMKATLVEAQHYFGDGVGAAAEEFLLGLRRVPVPEVPAYDVLSEFKESIQQGKSFDEVRQSLEQPIAAAAEAAVVPYEKLAAPLMRAMFDEIGDDLEG